jgi:excisionase family DNA binding protein
MELNLVSKKEFEELIQKVELIHTCLNKMVANRKLDGLFSNKEASKFLKVSDRTLQLYRDSGKIEFSQIGRKIFYKEEAIQQFLKENKAEKL